MIDLNNYTNYVTNVSKLKPTLDRANFSNMMITHNFLHREDKSVPNDDDLQEEVQNKLAIPKLLYKVFADQIENS
jgi:hypothetical protein